MINFKVILNVLGILLLALSALMLFPFIADIIKNNNTWMAFLISIGVTVSSGVTLILSTRDEVNKKLIMQDAFLLTTLSWIFICLFGSLPFYISDINFSLTDSIFESMSGVTTTGSTIIQDVESMPHGILIWRALLQWLGGVGIIVMAVSILPVLQVGGMQVFRTESSDTTEKILPKTTQIASAVIIIYLVLTLICLIFYWIFGMNLFDAFIHSMTTIATGGFSNYNESIGFFNSVSIEISAMIFIILGSLPFIAYIKFISGNKKILFDDAQIRSFFKIIIFSVAILTIYLAISNSAELNLRSIFFNIISILTGTGYVNAEFDTWGSFTLILFLGLMFIGGCAGSTTCGVKIFRIQILYLFISNQLKKIIYPKGVFVLKYDQNPIDNKFISSVISFIYMYLVIFFVLTALLSLTGLDFVTSISGAATSISNVGPGLGSIIGPNGDFSSLPNISKWILTLGMILGRLELFAILVLFLPSFWRN